jgi:hypothetical protein
MRICFELQDDEEAAQRLARECQLERRRNKNDQAYILFLKGLDAAEAERQARRPTEPLVEVA